MSIIVLTRSMNDRTNGGTPNIGKSNFCFKIWTLDGNDLKLLQNFPLSVVSFMKGIGRNMNNAKLKTQCDI